MIKPQFWYELPYSMRENVIDYCNLKYDPYESSFAEAKVYLLDCPNENPTNNKIVQNRFENMTIGELVILANNCKDSLKSQLEEVENLLTKKL